MRPHRANGQLGEYRIEPGPAKLTVNSHHSGGSGIQFLLNGNSCGRDYPQNDPVLWIPLVGLGIRLSECHTVISNVADAD